MEDAFFAAQIGLNWSLGDLSPTDVFLYNDAEPNHRKEGNALNGDKTKEQLLEELIRTQKNLEKRVEAQERFIRKFTLLTQSEGLLSEVLENLPYPVAIFEPGGRLHRVNHAMLREADLEPGEISMGRINFLNRVTTVNYAIIDATEDVFIGKTTLLRSLSRPLEMFCRCDDSVVSDAYTSAILFPVADIDGHISFGTIMLMD